jgi:hypothetical protein
MPGVIDHVNVNVKVDSQLLSALDLSTANDPIVVNIIAALTNGTASGQASQHWHDTRTLTASATENLDLAGGGLTNAFGVSLTFTKIKLVFVRAAAANINDVQFQRATTNGVPLFMAASNGIALSPGEWFMFFSPTNGKVVTAGTGDLFTVTNSAGGTSVNYDILIVGTD